MTDSFKHQTETFERFKDKQYAAILWEPGTGKTKLMIDILEHKFQQGEISAAIIVTTKSLMLNWANVELPKHATLEYNSYVWTRDKLKNFNHMYYFIINIDALITKAFIPTMREFIRMYPKYALVIDESTVVKSGKAKRTKMALKVAARATCRFIMTGTPVTNSPLDLYSQCEILKPNCLGYKSIYAFRGDFCILKTEFFGNRSFQVIKGYRNLDQLTNTLKSFSSIIKKEDCLDLPPQMYRTIEVPFTAEQKRVYDELRDKALVYIQSHEITAVNAVSLINRLLQICAGQIKVAHEQYVSIPNNRLDTLKELLEEAPRTIIWTSFVNTATDIMKMLGKEAIHLSSGLNITQRQEVLEHFREGNVHLVANPASSGHGITLTESHNVIYYSNSWSYEHRAQSEFRTHRIGQMTSVLYTDLIAPNTVEGKVIQLLKDKKDIANMIITNNNIKELLDA
jgi:SNF2 family DNA or RNA helicase